MNRIQVIPEDLAVLDEREAVVIECRGYGITLKAIGAEYGVGPERIRGIQQKARRKVAQAALRRTMQETGVVPSVREQQTVIMRILGYEIARPMTWYEARLQQINK